MSDGSRRRYPDRPLVGVGAILLDPPGERVLLIQRGAPPAEEQTPVARSDARQAAWVPIAEVADLPTTRGVPAAVTRALALARGELPLSPLLGA